MKPQIWTDLPTEAYPPIQTLPLTAVLDIATSLQLLLDKLVHSFTALLKVSALSQFAIPFEQSFDHLNPPKTEPTGSRSGHRLRSEP